MYSIYYTQWFLQHYIIVNICSQVESFHEHSGLHKINASSKNPIDIFSKWYSEHMAANASMTSAKAFSLATVSK